MVAPTPTGLRTLLCTAALIAVLPPMTACDAWYLAVNTDGLIFVSVVGVSGEARHRFRVRTRDARGATRTIDLPPSRELTLTPRVDGAFELNLLAPPGCRVEGANPRTVTVAAGRENRLVFDVRCSAG
jgi:hypothetical protein